ncbi:hypothetical protein NDU88_005485 [Pleurodeles waltl]|uniref:Uncharacterized protein n=1 Tax=Pleurodeles waltl TaxID=8319 RepID=A0AAV7WZN8_PLEWA|nr:hypothetical protein NDU88_005485 [Pleurodeles waltl]
MRDTTRPPPVRLGPARPFSPVARSKLSTPQTEGAPGPEPPLLPFAASHRVIPPPPGRPGTRAPGFHSLPGLARASPLLVSRCDLGPGNPRRRSTSAPDKSRVRHTQ